MIIVICATLLTLFKRLTGDQCLGMFLIGAVELLLESIMVASYFGL